MKKPLFLSILLMSLSAFAQATTILQRSFEDIAKTSEVVFEGEVISIETIGDHPKKAATLVTLKVFEVLRGELNEPTITLRYTGGVVNGLRLRIGGMTTPTLGEHGIYFVEKTDGSVIHPLSGWNQGHFLVKGSGAEKTVHASSGESIRGIKSSTHRQVKHNALNQKTALGVELGKGSDKAISLQDFKKSVKAIK
ncbi:MAG: hypothetical protein OIF38_09355 [Cellvibrionaceae bacterium]|nr:hypothetical protein [Cellvibrionaceae bacterium]